MSSKVSGTTSRHSRFIRLAGTYSNNRGLVYRFGCVCGKSQLIKATKQENPEQQIRAVALRLLARREHSRFELAAKLRQRRLPADLANKVLDEFETEGWLSDERFADVYARQRMDSGYGPIRIRSELQQRGIHSIPVCLKEVDDMEWTRRALRLRERRFGLQDLEQDWQEKVRQARFLTQRGYSADQVERALEVTTPDDA